MKRQNGFTLLEIMAAVGILGFVIAIAFSQILQVKKVFTSYQNIQALEIDFTLALNDLKKVHDRARRAAFASESAPKGHYLINNNGTALVLVDDTPCDKFNPGRPETELKVVSIQCCKKEYSQPSIKIDVRTATSIETKTFSGLTSACKKKDGLSIIQYSDLTASKIDFQFCYEDINFMNVAEVGFHNFYGSPLYEYTFRSTKTFAGAALGNRFMTNFYGLGNSGGAEMTYCFQQLSK